METWFVILLTISVSLLLKAFFNLFSSPKARLPPSPPTFPLLGTILWSLKSIFQIEQSIRRFRRTLGPIISLRIGPRPSIFVFDRYLAHQALIQNGSLFSDRPKSLPANKVMNSNQHNISSGAYGPLWRLLRRNLTSEILHPSRVKSYAHARKWVLDILFDGLQEKAKIGEPVEVLAHFRYAILCLLGLMCYGDKFSEEQIKEIAAIQRRVLTRFGKLNLLNYWSRFLLRKQWNELFKLRSDLESVLIPLIRARKEAKTDGGSDSLLAYVDTLLDLELPEEKRKLDEKEIVTLASEFVNAGTDTTSTALQWIMANLVKHPHIQERLLVEIRGVVGDTGVEEIKQDDLQKMPYLKAVVLESLRRHPPTHFVVPHCVTEDTVLGGYLIPKNGNVNFMVADMGWDPTVWEDPMAFKPERFMGGEVFDITGSREIKMPFGVGRGICPGLGLALLHLEYFVANLVWRFEWNAMDGDEISLEEKMEFTIVMEEKWECGDEKAGVRRERAGPEIEGFGTFLAQRCGNIFLPGFNPFITMGKKNRSSQLSNLDLPSSSEDTPCSSGKALLSKEHLMNLGTGIDVGHSAVKLLSTNSSVAHHHYNLGRSIFLKRSCHYYGHHHYSRRNSSSLSNLSSSPLHDERLSSKFARYQPESRHCTGGREKAFGFSRPERIRYSSLVTDAVPPGKVKAVCGVCQKHLRQKPYLLGNMPASGEFSVVTVLVCGHIYHAGCLEGRARFEDRHDRRCPICSASPSLS